MPKRWILNEFNKLTEHIFFTAEERSHLISQEKKHVYFPYISNILAQKKLNRLLNKLTIH